MNTQSGGVCAADTVQSIQRPRPRRERHIRNALIAIVFGVAVGGLAMEGMARWVVDDGMNFDIEMWKYARDLKRVSANPDIGHEHRPKSGGFYMGVPVTINSQGLRDREYTVAPKPPGTVRVMMLGDSLTFGWGVKSEDTPSKLLEASLNAGDKHPKYEVINTGVGNYNTVMEVTYFLDHGHQFKPDIVVLNYFINDAEPTPRRKTGMPDLNSYAAIMLYSAFDKLNRQYFSKSDWRTYYADLYRPDAPGWQAGQAAIAQLAAYCDKHGIKLLIANYPELHELRPYPFQAVTDAVAKTAAANQVQFVDLRPDLEDLDPKSLWVSPTDAHPNRTANLRIAAGLRKALPHSAVP